MTRCQYHNISFIFSECPVCEAGRLSPRDGPIVFSDADIASPAGPVPTKCRAHGLWCDDLCVLCEQEAKFREARGIK